MKLKYILSLGLAAAMGFAGASYADDGAKTTSKKSLEQRIKELEDKLQDAGAGGVKGSGIKLSGFVDTSYIVNLSDRENAGGAAPVAGSAAGGNTGRVFDSQFDAFNLNRVHLTIEKDKDDSKFPAGFRVDTLYGDDATVVSGGNSQGGTANDSEFAVEQAYINLGVPIGNGIDVKFGKMVCLVGYEVSESPANWQFSRSDAYRLMPITQTGITFGYKWNDTLTTTVGVINGWDNSSGGSAIFGSGNRNTDLSFVGRVDIAGPKTSVGDFNAFVASMYGSDVMTPATTTGFMATTATLSTLDSYNSYLWNVGGTWDRPFDVKQLTLGVDYLFRSDTVNTAGFTAPVAGGATELTAHALSIYGKWDWNKYLTSSGRFSWSNYGNFAAYGATGGMTGSASLGAVAVPASASGGVAFGALPRHTEVYSWTLTQAFNIWKDTLIRLEWRHDWTPDGAKYGFGLPGAAVGGMPDDIRQEQDTLAVNIVYSF